MVALAVALTGVPEVARDLAQDSLAKAYRSWDYVKAMDRPGSVAAAGDHQRRDVVASLASSGDVGSRTPRWRGHE